MVCCCPPSSPGFLSVPSWWMFRGLVWQAVLQAEYTERYQLVGHHRDKLLYRFSHCAVSVPSRDVMQRKGGGGQVGEFQGGVAEIITWCVGTTRPSPVGHVQGPRRVVLWTVEFVDVSVFQM